MHMQGQIAGGTGPVNFVFVRRSLGALSPGPKWQRRPAAESARRRRDASATFTAGQNSSAAVFTLNRMSPERNRCTLLHPIAPTDFHPRKRLGNSEFAKMKVRHRLGAVRHGLRQVVSLAAAASPTACLQRPVSQRVIPFPPHGTASAE